MQDSPSAAQAPGAKIFSALRSLGLSATIGVVDRRVVEAGTSFGVSTLYLAAAVRDNQVEHGVVIGTEYEPQKAASARANF